MIARTRDLISSHEGPFTAGEVAALFRAAWRVPGPERTLEAAGVMAWPTLLLPLGRDQHLRVAIHMDGLAATGAYRIGTLVRDRLRWPWRTFEDRRARAYARMADSLNELRGEERAAARNGAAIGDLTPVVSAREPCG